jgi:hypothetical protein
MWLPSSGSKNKSLGKQTGLLFDSDGGEDVIQKRLMGFAGIHCVALTKDELSVFFAARPPNQIYGSCKQGNGSEIEPLFET